jgi:hypothetical protein
VAERQILGWGTQSAPSDRTTKESENFTLLAVNANFDGTAAGSSWVPVIEIISDAGQVVARCVPATTFAVGDSAEVTFAPFLGRDGGGTGIQFDTDPQTGDWLWINTTTTNPTAETSGSETGNWSVGVNGPNVAIGASTGANPQLFLTSAKEVTIDANTGQLNISSGAGANWTTTGGATTFTTDALSVRSASLFMEATAAVSLVSDTSDISLSITAGHTVTVYDHLGNPIFRVNENGDLHGKTGKSLVFDL